MYRTRGRRRGGYQGRQPTRRPMTVKRVRQIAMSNEAPSNQANDVLVDVALVRWGFRRALTHEELMKSDPLYMAEFRMTTMTAASKTDPSH